MEELVSIIMPVYNSILYISDTINSVLTQTYTNFELIIVDDASSDGTFFFIKQNFPDSRIKMFQNVNNKGAAFSRNYAIKEAKGRFIAFLDADDYWYPEKLQKQVTFMIKNNYHFSFTKYYESKNNLEPLTLVSGPKKVNYYKIKKCCYFGCLTVMFDIKYTGLIQVDADIKKRNDYAMWLQIIKKEEAHLLPEILSIYRRRTGSISNVSIFDKLKWEKIIFSRYVTNFSLLAWYYACRVAFFTVLKKIKYKKKVR